MTNIDGVFRDCESTIPFRDSGSPSMVLFPLCLIAFPTKTFRPLFRAGHFFASKNRVFARYVGFCSRGNRFRQPWCPPRKCYRRLHNPNSTQSEGRYLAYGCRLRYIDGFGLRDSNLRTHWHQNRPLTLCCTRLSNKTRTKWDVMVFFDITSQSLMLIY